MDAISLVAYAYDVGSALVERCQFVKQCHAESARIAVRVIRVLGYLERADKCFQCNDEFDASLVELKDVLQQAQDLVTKCHKVKSVTAKFGALVGANTLKGGLIRVEADLCRVVNDLQLPMLTDIRQAVESVEKGGKTGLDAELAEAVRDAIRNELQSIGADGRRVDEVIGGQLSQVYETEPENPADPSPAEPVATGVLRCSGHGEECVLRTTKKEGSNHGRKFYCCPRNRSEACKMFAWADECDGGREPKPAHKVCKTHKEPCAIFRVKKEGPNQGRCFYNCARKGAERCSSFTWADAQPATAADPAPKTTVTTVITTTGGGGSSGRGGGDGACTTTTTTTTTTTACGGRGGGGGWSGSRGAGSGRSGSGPVCKGHQEPCRRQITKKEVRLAVAVGRSRHQNKGRNKGRPFYVCPRPRGEACNHFEWEK